MDSMGWIYPLLILTGMLSGFLSGLLGVGGGFLMVPVFIVLLPLRFRIDIAVLPQVAVATALAATIPATASAVIAQYRRGALPIGWAVRLAPTAGAGAAIGAIIAGRIHGVWVAAIFSAYAAYFGLRMIRGAGMQVPPDDPPIHTLATRMPARLIGGLIGLFSATAGVGGASLTVPYVLAQHDRLEMRNAIAVGSAVGLAIS
ncbi:sulfite exporter TauE/SafE family protein [Xanthomonas hortorum pv. pelargonii]|nr:sulfite exporter TauE/SafE family protein [Xanthomonas hortorum pv. pelargonii]